MTFLTSRNLLLLDLDGVLVDLHRHVAERHAQGYPYTLERREDCLGPDEIFEAWLPSRYLWEAPEACVTEYEFWADAPEFPWTRDLYRAAKKLGKVLICSNPGRDHFSKAAAAGKLEWCQRILKCGTHDVILMKDKHLIAKPGRFLVDDREFNIDPWCEEGGAGLLFPQPYNRNFRYTDIDPVQWFRDSVALYTSGGHA